MSQLVESIRIYNGKVYNITRHNARCNKSRSALFNTKDFIDLRPYINVPANLKDGLVKCRIVYDSEIRSVEFAAYRIKELNKIALVEDPSVRYDHKLIDRSQLDNLKSIAKDFDEIIITKSGHITDAYYYNVVLCINGQFLTPESCLLKGVMRQKLLDQSRINESQLSINDLKLAESIYLINALTPLGMIKLNPNQVSIIKR